MKQHEFQFAARQFRAGKISLNEFTDRFLAKASSGAESPAVDSDLIDTCLAKIRDRKPDSHKGDYGRILVVAGSPGMAGAAALTGMAALRCGAGLVTVATNEQCQATVAGFHPSLMTAGLKASAENQLESIDFDDLIRISPNCNCLVVGPGLGGGRTTGQMVRDIVTRSTVPVVVDADGLNLLGVKGMTEGEYDWSKVAGERVLTPHPGELIRLMAEPTDERSKQEQFAGQLATACRGVVVLKGHRTLITDGTQKIYNRTGNPGMATAGSGDVLSGIIGALIGQGLTIWQASVLGCYLHGKAGDIGAKIFSEVSLNATDIIDCLPRVMAKTLPKKHI